MKELRFQCPFCGQHVQCDASHVGENVPCPSCAQMIRVPKDAFVAEVSSSEIADSLDPAHPDAVSYAVSPEDALASNSVAESTAANPPLHTETPENSPPQRPAELRCACPVCRAELRISIQHDAGSQSKIFASRSESSASPPSAPETRPSAPLSLEERERKIAAARESLHIEKHTQFKPRLDKILGDNEHREAA